MRERKITLLGPEGTNVSIFFLFLIFNVISWFTLFVLTEGIELNFNNILIRQIVFTLLSVGVFFLLTYISIENLRKYTDSFFIIIVILLAVLLRTTPKAGVRRWFDLGPIDFQPSEFAKVIVVLFIANFFIQRRSKYPLFLYLGLGFWATLPIAIIVTAFFGVAMGIPSFRLEGPYLALATLGGGEAIRLFIENGNFFRSTFGLSLIHISEPTRPY